MGSDFRLWQRIVGVMALLLTFAIAAGWVRILLTANPVVHPSNGDPGTDITPAFVAHTGMVDPLADEKWGTLTGQILIEDTLSIGELDDESLVIDPESKAIANVIVYLPKRPDSIHPDLMLPQKPSKNDSTTEEESVNSPEIRIEIKNNRFVPHICLVRTGVNIRLVSHDQVTHAVQTMPVSNFVLMKMIPTGNTDGFQLPSQLKPEKLPFKVIDPTDASMSAYWLVLDHPYAAVTDKDGQFTIPQLPVGDHEFMFWHERKGYVKKRYKIKIKPGMNELSAISIGPF